MSLTMLLSGLVFTFGNLANSVFGLVTPLPFFFFAVFSEDDLLQVFSAPMLTKFYGYLKNAVEFGIVL
jgi:hypothetical protein